MKLFDLRTEYIDNCIAVTVSIESEKIDLKKLWFSTLKDYEKGVSTDRYDAFLVGLLYPAMEYGEDIYIEGVVSSKLLFNINHYVIPLIQSFSPSCKIIKVKANKVTTDQYDGQGVGTGFPGGIDSFCTIYDHLELEQDPDYRINSFLFLNVGSHGSEDEIKVRAKFHTRYDYLKSFTDEVGLNFIPVDSNLHLFHTEHRKTSTLTSASGILFMQKLYKKYYYASSGLDYSSVIETASKYRNLNIGVYCDPILLPLLSTESTELIADGTQYTRTGKTIKILDYDPVNRYLNVCVSGEDTHENCSVCSKCSRTLMTLNSIGKIDEFEHLFDIKKYKEKAEKNYISKQVLNQKKDPFAKDNIELAERKGVKLPNKMHCFFTQELLRLKIWASKNKLVKFAEKKLSQSGKKRI